MSWQYYYLIKTYLGYKAKDFVFDFECCYEDGNPDRQTDIENYQLGFYNALAPKSMRKKGYKELVR